MDIVEFFQQSAGKWFSQRTSHHLAEQQSQSGKSDLVIEAIANSDPAVVQLCQQHNVDSSQALCGMRISWNGTMERETKPLVGSTLLVALANPATPNEGTLLRKTGNTDSTATGRYVMGNDDALTLIIEDKTGHTEERIWFASPNLRFRSSTFKRSDGVSVASFCSEIRMLGAAQPSSSSTAASSKA